MYAPHFGRDVVSSGFVLSHTARLIACDDEPTPKHRIRYDSFLSGNALGQLTWTWKCRCGAHGEGKSEQRAKWSAAAHLREAA